jgi:hypothetical protein
MLLKMENDVNASLRCGKVRRHPEHLAHLRQFRRTEAEYIEFNNLLAPGVSCGRLASFAAPLLRSQGFLYFHSGAGRESFSGGRAAWASFFSSSSG